MMVKTKFRSLLFGLVTATAFALTGCSKENIDDIAWNPTVAIPLVSTSLSLDDILNDTTGIIIKNPDASLSLFYTTDLSSPNAEDLFSIPDLHSNLGYVLGGEIPAVPPFPPIRIEVPLAFQDTIGFNNLPENTFEGRSPVPFPEKRFRGYHQG